MLTEFKTASRKAGLSINTEKKALLSNKINKITLQLDGIKINEVKEIIYLGQILSFEDRMDKKLSRQKIQAWRNFWSLKNIYNSKLPLERKTKVLESCTMPSLAYGSQTWALTKMQCDRIHITQNAMLRRLIEVKKDEIRNERLRKVTKVQDIKARAKKLKMKYAGYIVRKREDKWERKALEWTPWDQKRRVGRPKK